jgi:hypothetical protein
VVHDSLHGGSRTTTGRLVPYVMFTDPELARVGCNIAAGACLSIARIVV